MKLEEYVAHDAVGLAGLVAAGEVSAHELLDCALAALEAVNPRLNAVTVDLADQGRAAIDAGLPDGPLKGVPYLIKDICALMKGVPTSSGCAVYKDLPAGQDSALVAAYRRAGLVLFGKTNTPELGLMPTTESKTFGAAHNPWDLSRTTGGSSGGSSAAVAAGVLPAAHANDGGGSIRVPASCCGLFGLKPSRGRVSLAPIGGGIGWFTCEHAVTRTVRDSAALLDASCGPALGDMLFLPPPATPFAAEVGKDPGRLRIGFSTAALAYGEISPECAAAVRATAKLCESLGHQVEEVSLDVDFRSEMLARHITACSGIAFGFDFEARRRGRPIARDEVEALSWVAYQTGKAMTAERVSEAIRILTIESYATVAAMKDYDVLLLSTLATAPIPLGTLNSDSDEEGHYREPDLNDLPAFSKLLYGFMPNTAMFNVTGQPAMSVPLDQSDEGLPIGIQFVGHLGRDAQLLRLAAQLETAQPWAHRRPPVRVG